MLYNAFEHERLRAALRMVNSDSNWTTSVMRSGPGTLTVTIPLPVTFMSDSFQDLDNVGDTLIHLYPRTAINTALSHTVMPVVTHCGCIIETDAITNQDRDQTIALHRTSIMSRAFCDPVAIDYNSTTLSATISLSKTSPANARGSYSTSSSPHTPTPWCSRAKTPKSMSRASPTCRSGERASPCPLPSANISSPSTSLGPITITAVDLFSLPLLTTSSRR